MSKRHDCPEVKSESKDQSERGDTSAAVCVVGGDAGGGNNVPQQDLGQAVVQNILTKVKIEGWVVCHVSNYHITLIIHKDGWVFHVVSILISNTDKRKEYEMQLKKHQMLVSIHV